MAITSSDDWLPAPMGSVIASNYRLSGVLGRGGMGVVCSALRICDGADVALKFVKPSCLNSTYASNRLLAEAKTASQISSPHVVRILETGYWQNRSPFIVMERLWGETLNQRLQSNRISQATAYEVVSQVCRGLRVAHDLGFVHRDITPANIFLCRHTNSEHVKVLDFGLSKHNAGNSETTTSQWLLGSAPYMSPEQIQKDAADPRSDIWSLGVVFHQMLTGKLPFEGCCAADTLIAILTRPPASLPPQLKLPRRISGVVRRCLCKHPADRYQSVEELSQALSAALDPLSESRELTLDRTLEIPGTPTPWG